HVPEGSVPFIFRHLRRRGFAASIAASPLPAPRSRASPAISASLRRLSCPFSAGRVRGLSAARAPKPEGPACPAPIFGRGPDGDRHRRTTDNRVSGTLRPTLLPVHR